MACGFESRRPHHERDSMKSLPYGKLGNWNLKGKKSKAFMAGKHVEDIVKNHKERELIKELEKEIRSSSLTVERSDLYPEAQIRDRSRFKSEEDHQFLGVGMKVTITSSFPLRGEMITSYYSYPVYSDEIEKTMARELKFLKQYDRFVLEMRITEGSEKSS